MGSRSNLGFNILPKDTSTCGPKEQEIKPLVFHVVEDELYFLSLSPNIMDIWVFAEHRQDLLNHVSYFSTCYAMDTAVGDLILYNFRWSHQQPEM